MAKQQLKVKRQQQHVRGWMFNHAEHASKRSKQPDQLETFDGWLSARTVEWNGKRKRFMALTCETAANSYNTLVIKSRFKVLKDDRT